MFEIMKKYPIKQPQMSEDYFTLVNMLRDFLREFADSVLKNSTTVSFHSLLNRFDMVRG